MTNPIQRVVLITGARSGIGAALSRRLANPGTALVLHSRGGVDGSLRDDLHKVAAEVENAGSPVATVFADLNQTATASGLVTSALKYFGRLDQIVSNAGFADRRLFGEVSTEDLQRSLQTMTTAFFELASAALPQLQQSDWGRVVAVSSFVAHTFDADGGLFPVSAAAKAGLEGLAKALAAQLAASGTTVNCVAPGYTRKDYSGHSALSQDGWQRSIAKTPLGRIAEPDDVAALIEFLLSRDARQITGQVIHVNGGLNLL